MLSLNSAQQLLAHRLSLLPLQACLCALNSVFSPLLAVDAKNVTREAATSAITACINVVFPPMQRAVSRLQAGEGQVEVAEDSSSV